MSAEILREAAALMRERAEAAEGEWFGAHGWYANHELHYALKSIGSATDAEADADYITSWHPAIAHAVANWLDATATDMAANTILDSPESGEHMPANPEALWCECCGGAIESEDYAADDQKCACARWTAALAVAWAYLT